MIGEVLLTFVPIFIAVDPPGLVPIFLVLTRDMDSGGRRAVVRQSVGTALVISLGFLTAGEFLFRLLGITTGDFLVAGGAILFIIAIRDVVTEEKEVHFRTHDVGAVPLGTPLIAGPAVLTTSLAMVDTHGWAPTLLSLVLNLLLAGALFRFSELFVRLLGSTGLRVISKVVTLFLAALGVLMVRQGMTQILSLMRP